MPHTALLNARTEERGVEPWTVVHELLSQLIEETAILAADHRRKKPRKDVPRPAWLRPATPVKQRMGVGEGPQGHGSGSESTGVAMFKATALRVIRTA